MDELKAKVYKAQSEGDIASLYVLEAQAHEIFDEDTLMAFYGVYRFSLTTRYPLSRFFH